MEILKLKKITAKSRDELLAEKEAILSELGFSDEFQYSFAN